MLLTKPYNYQNMNTEALIIQNNQDEIWKEIGKSIMGTISDSGYGLSVIENIKDKYIILSKEDFDVQLKLDTDAFYWIATLSDALQTLVQLKKMKDEFGKTTEYSDKKIRAWTVAGTMVELFSKGAYSAARFKNVNKTFNNMNGTTTPGPLQSPANQEADLTDIQKIKQLRKDTDGIIQRVKALPGSGELSLVVTKLQEGVMWMGMALGALGDTNPYPASKDVSTGDLVEKKADDLKM